MRVKSRNQSKIERDDREECLDHPQGQKALVCCTCLRAFDESHVRASAAKFSKQSDVRSPLRVLPCCEEQVGLSSAVMHYVTHWCLWKKVEWWRECKDHFAHMVSVPHPHIYLLVYVGGSRLFFLVLGW